MVASASLWRKHMDVTALLASSLLLVSCTHPVQNFKNMMDDKVGLPIDHPAALAARPHEWSIGHTTLPNGNIEEGYRGPRTCRYFFEIDKATNKIVGWRSEGQDGDCRVAP